MRAHLPFLVVLLPIGVVLAAACGSNSNNTGSGAGTTGTNATGTGSGNSTASGMGGTGVTGGSTGVGFAGSLTVGVGGAVPGGGCSPDLQHVIDGNGNVVKTCPSDQGCYAGTCEPACEAAANTTGTIGCDFYAPDTPFYGNDTTTSYEGACYAVFVANTWSRSAQITVSRNGQTFDMTQFGYVPTGVIPNVTYSPVPSTGVPANGVAVLFLSHKPGAATMPSAGLTSTPLTCPMPPALLSDAAVQGPGVGTAFHVASDTPVTAYDILPFGGALSYLPGASLLFPSTAWGTNYYVVAPHADGGGSLFMTLVGATDNTMVTAAPINTLSSPATNPPELGGGQATTFPINQGQTLQWINSDPTGTVIQATSPIAVFTGSTYLRVSSVTSPGGGGEDSAHQQLPQISALGSEYVAPGIVTRLASLAPESVPYRFMGVVAGTTLTYQPSTPAGAPTTLTPGQVAEFETTSLFVVTSQDAMHPFGVTQYMPGASFANPNRQDCSDLPMFGTDCRLGDEDWINLIPPAQYLQRYVFFTDPTYATTNLVITRVKGKSGFFADVTIDCLSSAVTGWMPVDAAGKYEVAYVDLVRGTMPVESCGTSYHEATSTGLFGVNVWGTDWQSSYGYPAGGNIGSVNVVKVPPMTQ
jgi:hypothetical protein